MSSTPLNKIFRRLALALPLLALAPAACASRLRDHVAVIPEPSGLLLAGTGLLAMFGIAGRRRRVGNTTPARHVV
jgi:hypothetical protein